MPNCRWDIDWERYLTSRRQHVQHKQFSQSFARGSHRLSHFNISSLTSQEKNNNSEFPSGDFGPDLYPTVHREQFLGRFRKVPGNNAKMFLGRCFGVSPNCRKEEFPWNFWELNLLMWSKMRGFCTTFPGTKCPSFWEPWLGRGNSGESLFGRLGFLVLPLWWCFVLLRRGGSQLQPESSDSTILMRIIQQSCKCSKLISVFKDGVLFFFHRSWKFPDFFGIWRGTFLSWNRKPTPSPPYWRLGLPLPLLPREKKKTSETSTKILFIAVMSILEHSGGWVPGTSWARGDFRKGDEDSNFFNFQSPAIHRMAQTSSPNRLSWRTKPLIHWMPPPFPLKTPFFSRWKCFVASPSQTSATNSGLKSPYATEIKEDNYKLVFCMHFQNPLIEHSSYTIGFRERFWQEQLVQKSWLKGAIFWQASTELCKFPLGDHDPFNCTKPCWSDCHCEGLCSPLTKYPNIGPSLNLRHPL